MLIDSLYKHSLIDPCRELFSNELFIVSGYASATFGRRHLGDLIKHNPKIRVNLIIGMPTAINDHMAFLLLHKEFANNFKGYYYKDLPPVHCKAYSWFNDSEPVVGFAGSANYSQFGFFSDQQLNQLSNDNPAEIKTLFDSLLLKSIFIPDSDVVLPIGHRIPQIEKSIPPGTIHWEIPDKRVTISFLDRSGQLPSVSGLNWGQRLQRTYSQDRKSFTVTQREPNQAYLSLKQNSRKEGFLPPRALTFSLITDDGESFDCVVAQDGRKAIESTYNNSLLGIYFRRRLGLPLGSKIEVDDLENYGRTDYTIEKIDEETFLLDFSVD